MSQKVERELARDEHPLFRFAVGESRRGVVLMIDLREGLHVEHHCERTLHEREIGNPQFHWTFQKLLYDCLHDFIVEMFERNPQIRGNRYQGPGDKSERTQDMDVSPQISPLRAGRYPLSR